MILIRWYGHVDYHVGYHFTFYMHHVTVRRTVYIMWILYDLNFDT